ncbi:MAG: hypothetical protein R3321_01850 [Nitrososphaeraceae archaeon]|nr:hypothetical protein [Nitrososphaeraceae archaeon]
MGFYVLRVKNEQIESDPKIVAEKIIQKYYELSLGRLILHLLFS